MATRLELTQREARLSFGGGRWDGLPGLRQPDSALKARIRPGAGGRMEPNVLRFPATGGAFGPQG